MQQRLTGVAPVAPTPFLADGRIDVDGMCRGLDCMIDQRVDAICVLANYSEQFLLSDKEDVCVLATAWQTPDCRRMGRRHRDLRL